MEIVNLKYKVHNYIRSLNFCVHFTGLPFLFILAVTLLFLNLFKWSSFSSDVIKGSFRANADAGIVSFRQCKWIFLLKGKCSFLRMPLRSATQRLQLWNDEEILYQQAKLLQQTRQNLPFIWHRDQMWICLLWIINSEDHHLEWLETVCVCGGGALKVEWRKWLNLYQDLQFSQNLELHWICFNFLFIFVRICEVLIYSLLLPDYWMCWRS